MKIKIKFDTFEVEGELDSNKAAGDIIKFLPLEGKANLWGGEVFVELPEMLPYPGEAEEVEVGDIAYWQEGPAICFFFGETPGSFTDKPRPHSPVVVIGKLENPEPLKYLKAGVKIRVEKV
ncbi:MAG TPA: cyclophilin-like fold protein [archaeon]|nr:cyclophilin-like fold protein [archaeon]